MKKLFCAGMALLIAGSSWAIENLRINGDSIHFAGQQESLFVMTFDFDHPGDTVNYNFYFDLNRNLNLDQADLLYNDNLAGQVKLVDGQEGDGDRSVNGKWRSSGNIGYVRNGNRLFYGPDSFCSQIYEVTDKSGSQQAVFVDTLGLSQEFDTALTGHVYSENGALIESGFTVGGITSVSYVVEGVYALAYAGGFLNSYIMFGPYEAIRSLYYNNDTSAYRDSLRNLVYFTHADVYRGIARRETLDLYYDLSPTVVNFTMLDTITGDTVKDPQLELRLTLIWGENCMIPYSKYKEGSLNRDTLTTGRITRRLYMGPYNVTVAGIANRSYYKSFGGITVLAGDTVLNITLKTGSIPSAVSSGKSKPMAHESGLSVAVRTEAGHGVCMDWTGTQVSRIEISSLDGRALKTYRPAPGLKNGRIIWDGTTLAGHRAAPGVYLVRFETGTREYIKKVMLIH